MVEGGQTEIFNVEGRRGIGAGSVVKVMEDGCRLRDLEKQMRLRMHLNQCDRGGHNIIIPRRIHWAILLKMEGLHSG